jgi:hypothetical protein
MTVVKNSMETYLNTVGEKLSKDENVRMLQFGTVTPIAGERVLRDADGMMMTRATVAQSARNLHFCTEGRDEIAKKYANFSDASTGYEAVTEVKTMGAIDLTIISLAKSIIPFVAVDRGMDTPDATLYYNDLVSVSADGVGGVNRNEVVLGNFSVPNARVDLDANGTVTADVPVPANKVLSFDASAAKEFLIPGTVTVKGTVTVSGVDTEFTGKDYASDGEILFPGKSGIVGTIDYDTGKLNVTGLKSGTTAEISFTVDQAADNTGSSTLTVVPKWTGIPMKSTPQNIILQDNLANRMYMAKAQTLATGGKGGMSQADILFARTKDVYVEFLNKKVLKELIAGVPAAMSLNLSDYSTERWASTKNDMIIQAVTSLQARFLASVGIAGTVLVTGTMGVALLSCVPFMWTPNPEVNNGVNGLAGYFNGLPVYRHTYIDARTPGGKAQFYLACKLADNQSGSCVYGEFLPMTSTGVCSNFQMPQNISNGFFSQTACTRVDSKLIKMLEVVLPTQLFGTESVSPYPIA